MKISNFDVFLNLYLRKSYYKSQQWHFPELLQNVFSKLNFKLLQHFLNPYLIKSLRKINNIYFHGYKSSKIIWIFWWQGYKDMPLIIKKCIKSFKVHSNGYNVILITYKNIRKYIHLPEYIYNRVLKQGRLAHFSDIVRFNLLKKYGGLWCDSDLLCTSDLNKDGQRYLYTVSGGVTNPYPPFTHGDWVMGLIGGYDYNSLFTFMCEYLNMYWRNNVDQISYFISDFGLYFAYNKNIGGFKDYILYNSKYNNPDFWKMISLLNDPFSYRKYQELTRNTNIFRLTYKLHNKRYSNKSFYHYLMTHINE